MMNFGSRLDSSGEVASEGTGKAVPVAGVHIENCELVGIEMYKDRDGNVSTSLAGILFKQPNGSVVKKTLFEPKPSTEQVPSKKDPSKMVGNNDWQLDGLNATIQHVAPKIMTEDAYHAAIAAGAAPTSFSEFITKANNVLLPASKGMKFTMKFVYELSKDGKYYVVIPTFAPWISKPENALQSLFAKATDLFTPGPATASNPTMGMDAGGPAF